MSSQGDLPSQAQGFAFVLAQFHMVPTGLLLSEGVVTSHHPGLAQEYGERDNPKSYLSNKQNMQANKCFKLRSELHSVELTEFLVLRSNRNCKYKIKEKKSHINLSLINFIFPCILPYSLLLLFKKKKFKTTSRRFYIKLTTRHFSPQH